MLCFHKVKIEISEVYAFSPLHIHWQYYCMYLESWTKLFIVSEGHYELYLYIYTSPHKLSVEKKSNNFPLTNAEEKAYDISLVKWQ